MMTQELVIDLSSDAHQSEPAGRILEAVSYLNQCSEARKSFAVVTGPDIHEIRSVLAIFLGGLRSSCRVARVLAPTDSSHGFLEAILAQLGFEPFESTADDLQRLLTVVLRQGAGPDAGTIIVMEDAQDFGPRVLEAVRELARNSRDLSPPPLIVMAGHPGLNRVLDSTGMTSVAQLTRRRFDLGAARREVSPPVGTASREELPPRPEGHASLVLSLNKELICQFGIDRDRLLIGRSPYSDICIASRFVSRQHALLMRNSDGDWLIDLKSTNGTSVNSELTQHRRLDHGDVISIGNYRLRYDNPLAAAPASHAARPTRDQLSETMVMRSLKSPRAGASRLPPQSDSTSTAA